jgi:hypothetical protein
MWHASAGQHLIRRNLHAMPGPAQTLAGLRRLAQHLASFVAVERSRKAKMRPTNSPVSLSAWELDCHASADQHVAGQLPCPVVREYPLSTARDSFIGHAAGTLPACHARGTQAPNLLIRRGAPSPTAALATAVAFVTAVPHPAVFAGRGAKMLQVPRSWQETANLRWSMRCTGRGRGRTAEKRSR